MTLSIHEIAELLRADDNAAWSNAGALALADHLDQLDYGTGEHTEFDRVAIRCDYTEYETLTAWAEAFFGDDWQTQLGADEDKLNELILDYIQDRGTLIGFDGGVIVSNF